MDPVTKKQKVSNGMDAVSALVEPFHHVLDDEADVIIPKCGGCGYSSSWNLNSIVYFKDDKGVTVLGHRDCFDEEEKQQLGAKQYDSTGLLVKLFAFMKRDSDRRSARDVVDENNMPSSNAAWALFTSTFECAHSIMRQDEKDTIAAIPDDLVELAKGHGVWDMVQLAHRVNQRAERLKNIAFMRSALVSRVNDIQKTHDYSEACPTELTKPHDHALAPLQERFHSLSGVMRYCITQKQVENMENVALVAANQALKEAILKKLDAVLEYRLDNNV